MTFRTTVIGGALAVLAACSSVPGGTRTAAAPGFEVGQQLDASDRIVVLDAAVTVGTLSSGDAFTRDDAASRAASSALQAALATALRDEGLSARPLPLEGQNVRAEVALALDDLYAMVEAEGLARRGDGLTIDAPRHASVLAEELDADYALVTVATGASSSGGRRVSQALGAAMAVGVGVGYVQPGGGQYATVGLYAVDAGRLVWVHKETFGRPSLRDPQRAQAVAEKILAPLGLEGGAP